MAAWLKDDLVHQVGCGCYTALLAINIYYANLVSNHTLRPNYGTLRQAIWAGSIIYSIEMSAVFSLIASPILYAVVYNRDDVFLLAFIASNTLSWMFHAYILSGWPSLSLTACGKSFSAVWRYPTTGRLLYVVSYGHGVLQLWLLVQSEAMAATSNMFVWVYLGGLLTQYLCAIVGAYFVPLKLYLFQSEAREEIGINVDVDEDTPLLRDDGQLALTRLQAYASGRNDGMRSAERTAGLLSMFSFRWVTPLMVYGYVCRQLEQIDLLTLPKELDTMLLADRFDATLKSRLLQGGVKHPLLATFNRQYGWIYYPLGLLKLVADLLNFVGPIVLHAFVTLVESNSGDASRAYLYAVALCGASFLASLCNTQYSFRVAKVQVAVRAAIVSSVFRKALRTRVGNTNESNDNDSKEKDSPAPKKQDEATKFQSTGSVLNLMSTDCDRLANFCPSFHQFWSLPFQIAVALYLLYRQVGVAFLAGLVFAICMIPLNKIIADRIGALSQQMMKHKDARVELMREVLAGIRVVKSYAWEASFEARIQAIRERELKALRGRKYLDAVCVYLWATTPVLISILTFATYVLLGHTLTAAKVFTSMSLFSILIGPLNAFPWVLNGLMEAWVSVKRVESYYHEPELDSSDPQSLLGTSSGDNTLVAINKGLFTWTQQTMNAKDFILSVPMLEVRPGELVVVVGKTGQGKSTLLHALMAELNQNGGEYRIAAQVRDQGFAYARQEAWIMNQSVRDNIVCLAEFDPLRYAQVLQACCLGPDLDSMPARDQTELGASGHGLSGGQKARIELARCAYQTKPLYLLDDPLAALDPHVAGAVLQHCIVKRLKPVGCVLCTHNIDALQYADRILVVQDGLVQEMTRSEAQSVLGQSAADASTVTYEDEAHGNVDDQFLTSEEAPEVDGKTQEEEKRLLGTVAYQVYRSYWQAAGGILCTLVLLSLLIMQASRNLSDWWLSHWVTSIGDGSNHSVGYYLGIYGGISGANTLFTLLRAFLFAYAGIVAARVVHGHLLKRVFSAPVGFFDTNPLGRLINRFSSDVYGVDDSLPFILNILLAQTFGLVGTIAITCYTEPYLLILLVPLSLVYYSVQKYYRQTSREIKRLNSISRSPIYAHFDESLQGVASIRAMRLVRGVERESCQRMDPNQVATYNEQGISQWLGFRLQLLGLTLLAGVAFLAAVRHNNGGGNAGLIGLGISYSLSVTGLLQGLVTAFTETEKEMVAVERCTEYDATADEFEGDTSKRPPTNWPKDGTVRFEQADLRYRPNLPRSLQRVTLNITSGQKVGVCGRTGAGKSSLFQALLRLTPLDSGRILIGGVDISALPLHTLRSSIASIPQDPVLFSGTLRDNLDPFSRHTDQELWDTLELCQLQAVIHDKPKGLLHPVEESGRNFSLGTRQLICLGRALLRRAKLICIDEATASVDGSTDQLIQQTLRSAFADATVITVAHRIATIKDSDLIVVMDKGRVAEAGAPDVLLESKGLFAAMVEKGDDP